MNKRFRFIIISLLLATVLGISGIVVFNHVPYTTLSYTESDDLIQNPSRGFYVQFDSGHLEELNLLEEQGISLVLLAYDIQDFVDAELSGDKLSELTRAFNAIRANGLKVIFRAAYGFSSTAEYGDPISIDRVLAHVAQLKPILQANADLLLTVQAGFLGPWGEWHHSNLGADQGKPTAQVINALLVALCDAVPTSVSIAVRRPSFMRLIDPTQVDISRIAFHNDALLSTESDMGSYDLEEVTRYEELAFIHDRPYPVANGGEMPMISDYTQPDIAALELAQLKLTYLNHEYNKDVIAMWETVSYHGESFLNYIQRKMGYRFSLRSARIPSSFRPDQKVTLKLSLANSGFAALSLPYRAELILLDDQGIVEVMPFEGIDLRNLGPESTLTLNLTWSMRLKQDRFTLGIRILERDSTKILDERRLILLANEGLAQQDRITIFASYVWDGKEKYVLDQP